MHFVSNAESGIIQTVLETPMVSKVDELLEEIAEKEVAIGGKVVLAKKGVAIQT